MTLKTRQDIINFFDYQVEIGNANKAYRKFLDALKTKDNKKIEETEVIECLDIMIDHKNGFVYSLNEGIELYRARIIDEGDLVTKEKGFEIEGENIKGYNYYNSKEPPITISSTGRNNISGVSYLYAADTEFTACAEVKSQRYDLISVVPITILKQLKIVDFSKDRTVNEFNGLKEEYDISPGKLITNIMYQFSKRIKTDEEYFISQYIADYFRKAGFDGIKYGSFLGDGNNYTIFNSHKSNVKFGDSSIVISLPNKFYNLTQNRSIVNTNPFLDEDFDPCFLKDRLIQKIKQGRNRVN